ncbi:MAG: dimethylargininase [Acidobacteria bacterium]|nr:MAG: dimethylargininase [Acidobacteriota bacterium]REJ97970.1 MAG: dimethylargininase [Acidobacteriota bacterium]REK16713.1 MAG: dimethylargininase [Acidobacteriota bacterium]REK42624.1 MAG: dimethylargininase [Acidobacteriota bacterium]
MNTALVRLPPRSIEHCELTNVSREPIKYTKLVEQHACYRRVLQECNYTVITMPADESLPDSVFVEDTALVLPEAAVLFPLGIDSRQGETVLIRPELEKYREVFEIRSPAKIEGGDVLQIGKRLFVGLSTRTNEAGVSYLRELSEPLGYQISAVSVANALHLKTAVTAVDNETVILNPEWVDRTAFESFEILTVGSNEPFAANALRLENKTVVHDGFKRTNEKLREAGADLIEIDISEFLKAEAGLTCLSLLF